MEPIEDSLRFVPTKSFASVSEDFSIYTHSRKSKLFVLVVFLSYLIIFALFTDFVREKLSEPDTLPELFLIMGDPHITRWVYYLVCGGGWALGCVILGYFLWATTDIWGLEVWTSQTHIKVINTISGPYFKSFTGVGSIDMAEIEELRPGQMVTHVIGGGKHLKFSPVDRLDMLIAAIMANAKNVRISD